jgi:hypothetical protein
MGRSPEWRSRTRAGPASRAGAGRGGAARRPQRPPSMSPLPCWPPLQPWRTSLAALRQPPDPAFQCPTPRRVGTHPQGRQSRPHRRSGAIQLQHVAQLPGRSGLQGHFNPSLQTSNVERVAVGRDHASDVLDVLRAVKNHFQENLILQSTVVIHRDKPPTWTWLRRFRIESWRGTRGEKTSTRMSPHQTRKRPTSRVDRSMPPTSTGSGRSSAPRATNPRSFRRSANSCHRTAGTRTRISRSRVARMLPENAMASAPRSRGGPPSTRKWPRSPGWPRGSRAPSLCGTRALPPTTRVDQLVIAPGVPDSPNGIDGFPDLLHESHQVGDLATALLGGELPVRSDVLVR